MMYTIIEGVDYRKLGRIPSFSQNSQPTHPLYKNYRVSIGDDFVDRLKNLIPKGAYYFRIHNHCGYFYSLSYFKKWCELVSLFPTTKFYAYISPLDKIGPHPKNLHLIGINTNVGDSCVSTKDGETCPRLENVLVFCAECMKCLDHRMRIPYPP